MNATTNVSREPLAFGLGLAELAGGSRRARPRSWPGVAALAACALFLALAAAMLWYQDWRYSLPTPRPADLVQIPVGAPVAAELGALAPGDGRPLVLNFFGADCPCSRFALEHVNALLRAHAVDARFVGVIEGSAASSAGRVTGLEMPELGDRGARLATSLGVYSTPQAVIVAPDGTLWYRGNYNASRYCTRPESEFARRALEALLAGEPRPEFPAEATVAYGCALEGAGAAP